MFWRNTDYPLLDLFNVPAKICVCDNKHERELKNDLEQRKSDPEGEKYMIMWEEKKWNNDRGDLKEENKKLEYKIADKLNAGDQSKTKLKRLKSPFFMINFDNLATYAYVKTICNFDCGLDRHVLE
jgi:hypothetical protein